MKKSIVAVGVIAVLAVGYVGISWHTGNMIESNIDRKINQFSQKVNQNLSGYNLAISYSDYQKNIFSTKMHVTIKLSPKEMSGEQENEESSTLFDDDITIHHGPFPLEALKNGQFSPQMAWLSYEMAKDDSPELWKLAGDKPLLHGSIGVSYQEYITLKLANEAINESNENTTPISRMSAGELISFHANKDFTDVIINSNINEFTMNNPLRTETVTIKNLALSAINSNANNDYKYTFGIDSFSIKSDGFFPTQLSFNNINSVGNVDKDFKIDSKLTIDDITYTANLDDTTTVPSFLINNVVIEHKSIIDEQSKMNGEFTTSIGSITYGKQQLGQGDISISYKGLNDNIWPDSNLTPDPALVDKQTKGTNVDTVKLSLNNLAWHNKAGDLKAQFGISLSGENLNLRKNNVDNIDNVDVNINIPFKVLGQIVAQLKNPQAAEITQDQLDDANQLVYMSAGVLLRDSSPLIELDKDGIHSDIKYSKGNDEVIANGNTYNKDEFIKKVSKKF